MRRNGLSHNSIGLRPPVGKKSVTEHGTVLTAFSTSYAAKHHASGSFDPFHMHQYSPVHFASLFSRSHTHRLRPDYGYSTTKQRTRHVVLYILAQSYSTCCYVYIANWSSLWSITSGKMKARQSVSWFTGPHSLQHEQCPKQKGEKRLYTRPPKITIMEGSCKSYILTAFPGHRASNGMRCEKSINASYNAS
jgi:hypothetical protein